MNPKTYFVKFCKVINHIMYVPKYFPTASVAACTEHWVRRMYAFLERECSSHWIELMHPGRIGTWARRQVGDVFGSLQWEKQGNLYCTNDSNSLSKGLSYSKKCGTRTFKQNSHRIVLSTKLLLVAEDTENKFRAVQKLLVENHYEILMVEAGAEKICTAHLNPRCQTEATNDSLIRICISWSGLNIDFLLNHQSLIAFCIFVYLWLLYDVCTCLYPVSLRFCFWSLVSLGPLKPTRRC